MRRLAVLAVPAAALCQGLSALLAASGERRVPTAAFAALLAILSVIWIRAGRRGATP